MRNLLNSILVLAVSSLVNGCSSEENTRGNFGIHPHVNTKENLQADSIEILKRQFAQVHIIADSVVKLAISDPEAWKFIITEYDFSYPHWGANLDDSLPGPALEYGFYYGLLFRGDTIRSAVVKIGPDMRIHPSEPQELVAYKYFFNGDLSIGPEEALEKAVAQGVDVKGASVTFHSSGHVLDTLKSLQQVREYYNRANIIPESFYWDIQSQCNGCVTVRISAASGEVLEKGTVVYQY